MGWVGQAIANANAVYVVVGQSPGRRLYSINKLLKVLLFLLTPEYFETVFGEEPS